MRTRKRDVLRKIIFGKSVPNRNRAASRANPKGGGGEVEDTGGSAVAWGGTPALPSG
ncbi:unnamed protein product, partial [Ectocarpus sp. 13 AM-2016]